jgi:DNA-binding transcriptional MerR regulator
LRDYTSHQITDNTTAQDRVGFGPRSTASDVLRGIDLSIGEIAKRTGLSVHALRFYEREGLLLSGHIPRGRGGRRRYSASDVDWIAIFKLRASGMPLSEIRRFAELVREGLGNEHQRLELLREHQRRVAARLAESNECLELITWKVGVYEQHLAQGTAQHLWTAEPQIARRLRSPSSGTGMPPIPAGVIPSIGHDPPGPPLAAIAGLTPGPTAPLPFARSRTLVRSASTGTGEETAPRSPRSLSRGCERPSAGPPRVRCGRVRSASTDDRLTLASGSDCERADVVVRHDCRSSTAGTW